MGSGTVCLQVNAAAKGVGELLLGTAVFLAQVMLVAEVLFQIVVIASKEAKDGKFNC